MAGAKEAHALFGLQSIETAIAVLPKLEQVTFVAGNEAEEYEIADFRRAIHEDYPLLAAKGVLM